MDVWGPARVRGQGHERYFVVVVDLYSRYTAVFPLRSKGEVPEVLIEWIRGARRQISESFGSDLRVLRLHSDRGGEFSSDLLRAFCRSEGIRQTFTLPASPQQNGIAERRIGMVMDVASTSMIHAAAPYFLWPFAVQYAAHQINLQPRVSLPETTPTMRFFPRYSTDKLSSHAVPCVFLGFPPDASGWQFYHPTSRRVLSSQDVTFDESVSYYCLFPYRTASPPHPPPLFLAAGTPPVDPLPPQGPAPSSVSQVDPAEPVEVAVDFGATRGAEPAGAGTGGADSGGVEPAGAGTGGAESGGAEPGRVEPEGTMSEGAEPARADSGGALGVPSRREPLSPQQLREWYSRRCWGATGATGGAAGARGAAGVGAAGGAAGAGAAGAAGGAAGAGAAGAARGATGTGDPGAEGTGSPASPLLGPTPYPGLTRGLTERREPESRPVSPESRSASPVRPVRAGRVSRTRPPTVPSTHSMTQGPFAALQRVPLSFPPASSLPVGLDSASDSLRAACPAVTRFLAIAVIDPLFASTGASAFVTELVAFAGACRLDYATSLVAESVSASVCPPSVGGECALGTYILEDRQEEFECFAASVPHLVSMLLAPEGDPDAPDIPTPRTYAEAIEGPYSSQWQAAMDAEMAPWKSTGTYVDEVPPHGANIVSGMWIFRVKRPPSSPPVFKARYVARGFSQQQGVDFFQTFSPTPKMTTFRVLLHVAAQRDYELHSLDFSTAFLQGSLHEEIWLRCPPGFTGSLPAGTQWSLRRPVYGLRQAPREWLDTLRTTLLALGFAPSTSDPSLFLRTDTTLPPFYVLVYVDNLVFATADTEALAHVKSELQKRHTCTDLGELKSYLGLRITQDTAQRTISDLVLLRFGFTYSSPQSTPLPTGHLLSAPPSDESVEPSGPYPELVGCLMYLMNCTQPDLAYPLSLLAHYVAPGRHQKVHWDAPKRVLRYLCSTSGMGLVLGGRARVVLTGHADASWELRWLTYLLTDLGEAPRSPPVMYVDNKAMLALCQEHRLEHRMKHIALRYFLAREPPAPRRPPPPTAATATAAGAGAAVAVATATAATATAASAAATAATATAATAAPACSTTMASLRVLAFDHEGRPIQFDTWLDDLKLYLRSDPKDRVSLFDLAPGAALAPPAIFDSATRSQWLSHLQPPAVSRMRSLRTAQDSTGTFATVEDLLSHLRASDARYRATVLAEFLDTNLPPMLITLYFIVTRLPDSLHSNRDQFLSLDPTSLTVDLLEEHLLAIETSAVAVGAACGNPCTPFFEGCSPPPPLPPPTPLLLLQTSLVLRTSELLPLVRSAAAARARVAGVVEGAAGVVVGAAVEVVEAVDVVAVMGLWAGVGALAAAVEVPVGVAAVAAVGQVALGLELRVEVPEVATSSSSSVGARPGRPSSFVSGCFNVGRLGVVIVVRMSFARVTRPRWADLLRSGVAIFDLDFDVFLSAMYALSVIAEGNCHRCVPPDLGIAAAALGASELGTFPGTVPAEALHTFTLDSAPPCSCLLLLHQTLLWHHRLGHPSLLCLRGMHSRLLVSGLLRSLPPLPPLAAPPCLPCVEGRQRAAPHSFSFPPTTAPLQNLHMDVWGPARVSGQGRECFFLLVVDDYKQYTTVFPLRTKGQVVDVLIPSIRAVRLQLGERFRADLLVLHLHSNRGERFEPASRPTSPVRSGHRVPRTRPLLVLSTHALAVRPSFVPLRVPLLPPPESSLPAIPDPKSDRARAASPTVSRLLATIVTDPSFESTTDTPSVGGECALGTDVLKDRQEDIESLAAAVPHFASMLLAPEGDPDAPDIPTSRSYAEAITALGFTPATADPSLFLRTDTSQPPFYVLVYVDDLVFATADIEALNLVKSELQKRHTCTDLGELRNYLGLQITRDRARRTITLTQSHMVHQVLQRFVFQFSSPQPNPMSIGHSLSAPPSDETIEPSGPYPELVGCLMYLMTCTRLDLAYPLSILARYVAPGKHRKVHLDAAKRVLRYLCSTSGMGLVYGGRSPLVLTGHADASWVYDSDTQRSSQGYTFSLGSGSVSWRSTRSSSVLSSNCEAEIYAGAMAAQERRWLTNLLTDLGERPRSPPVLFSPTSVHVVVSRAQTGAQNEAHRSAMLPCSRVAAAWPSSSCVRGHSGQHY
ncbi:unnamed protein product [Closterium sp. NIES-54]